MLKQITILGRTYNVRADENDDIERAAADVDRRMRAMSGRGSSMDNYTVALLTALNLAAEVQSLTRRTRVRLEELEREAAAVEAGILGDTAKHAVEGAIAVVPQAYQLVHGSIRLPDLGKGQRPANARQ